MTGDDDGPRWRDAIAPRRWLWFAVRVGAYVAVMLGVLYAIQDRLIYFPDRLPPGEVPALAARLGLAPWPPGEAEARGFLRAPQGPARGTVVVFHGNAGTALDRTHYADALVPRGFRVLLLEYPGYGARGGALGEAAFVADGCESLRGLRDRFGGPLHVIGESLGAGVAASVVAGCPGSVDGLVLLTPWDSLADLGRTVYPFLPVGLLLRDRYDSIANLRGYAGPVAVLVAERDRVIPPRHAHRLYEALPEPKRLWTFPGSGHNDWPASPETPWWDEVLAFLNE